MTTWSRTRRRAARALLVLLLGTIVSIGAQAGFRTAPSVDSRTYIEMIRGFTDNGLPYLDNPAAADIPEGQARWNAYHDGHLWGVYPPLFPLVASYPFRIGGLPLVTRLNCIVSLGLIALGTAALGARLMRDPLAGVIAAYAAMAGTFVGALGVGIDSFALCTALVIWSCYFGLRTIDTGSYRCALAAGSLGGAGAAAHLLAFPMLFGLAAAVTLTRRADEAPVLRVLAPRLAPAGYVEAWLPSRASLARALLLVLASVVVLSPVAWLNHLRFDSFNPVTYGPCMWQFCRSRGTTKLSLSASLAYALPLVVTIAGLGLALWYLRQRSRWWLLAIPLVMLAFVLSPGLRGRLLDTAVCTIAYIADNAAFALPPFAKPPDGLGNFFGAFVVKSLLQGSPYLALAFISPWVLQEHRRVAPLLLPAMTLVATLGLRSNIQLIHALGFPFLFLRYLAPAMPVLTVLAVATARKLRLGVAGWLALTGTAAVGAYVLWGGNDEPLLRRVLLLRVTLIVAVAVAAFALMRMRRSPLGAGFGVCAGAAFGLGVAISMAVDGREIWNQRVAQDALLARFERLVPARFALVGWAAQIDPLLSLRATHDVQYIDFFEATDWSGLRTMIERWTEEDRPIYGAFPRGVDVHSPWPDVVWQQLDQELWLFRVRKQ